MCGARAACVTGSARAAGLRLRRSRRHRNLQSFQIVERGDAAVNHNRGLRIVQRKQSERRADSRGIDDILHRLLRQAEFGHLLLVEFQLDFAHVLSGQLHGSDAGDLL